MIQSDQVYTTGVMDTFGNAIGFHDSDSCVNCDIADANIFPTGMPGIATRSQ